MWGQCTGNEQRMLEIAVGELVFGFRPEQFRSVSWQEYLRKEQALKYFNLDHVPHFRDHRINKEQLMDTLQAEGLFADFLVQLQAVSNGKTASASSEPAAAGRGRYGELFAETDEDRMLQAVLQAVLYSGRHQHRRLNLTEEVRSFIVQILSPSEPEPAAVQAG